jgi:WD40 repeat protein
VVAAFTGYGEQPFAGGWILRPREPQPIRVAARQSVCGPALTADGQLAAFFIRPQDGKRSQIKVFNTSTGKDLTTIAATGLVHYIRFTPDGRHLATDVDGGSLLSTQNWEVVRRLGGGELCDVSPDGTKAVYQMQDHIFRLVDVATGTELVRLEDPERLARRPIFTPDSMSLVASARDGFRVWDLRRIRTELSKMGLDWDAPPYPAANDLHDAPPLSVQFDSRSKQTLK